MTNPFSMTEADGEKLDRRVSVAPVMCIFRETSKPSKKRGTIHVSFMITRPLELSVDVLDRFYVRWIKDGLCLPQTLGWGRYAIGASGAVVPRRQAPDHGPTTSICKPRSQKSLEEYERIWDKRPPRCGQLDCRCRAAGFLHGYYRGLSMK